MYLKMGDKNQHYFDIKKQAPSRQSGLSWFAPALQNTPFLEIPCNLSQPKTSFDVITNKPQITVLTYETSLTHQK